MGEECEQFEEVHDAAITGLMYLLATTELMKDNIKDAIVLLQTDVKNIEEIKDICEGIRDMGSKYAHLVDSVIEDCDGEKGSGTENQES